MAGESTVGPLPPTLGTQTVVHLHGEQPVSEYVEVARGQRGGVGWTIRAHTIERVVELDNQLKAAFAADLAKVAGKEKE